jgi:hypothetical protein
MSPPFDSIAKSSFNVPMTHGMKGLLWLISPSQAAETSLAVAHDTSGPAVFVPARWGLVALIIRLIPSFIFRRLNI